MAMASQELGHPTAAIDDGGGKEAPLENVPAAMEIGRKKGGASGGGTGNRGRREGGCPSGYGTGNRCTRGGGCTGGRGGRGGWRGGRRGREEEGVKWLKHYSSMQSILIVGDGDFSFSRALAIAFCSAENLVTRSLDSYEALTGKYCKAESNILVLKIMGATILYGIDAKTMKLHADLKMRRFDRIIFNFPHAGFKGKEDHMDVINSHKMLVRGFLCNASHLIRPNGEIHVSHKTGYPYDKWDIEQLAFESSLIVVEKVGFLIEDYPGYNQKRGDGANCDEPFNLGVCCTFKFCIRDSKKLKKVHGNRISSTPSLGGSTSPCSLFPPPVGIVTSPYFHQHGTIQPMCSTPGPGSSLNVLPILGGVLPPMSRITSTSLLAPQQQPWFQQGPIFELLRSDNNSHFAREYLASLLREYEVHRQAMPGATNSNHSVLLEHRFRESVACALLQEWLQRVITLCGRL